MVEPAFGQYRGQVCARRLGPAAVAILEHFLQLLDIPAQFHKASRAIHQEIGVRLSVAAFPSAMKQLHSPLIILPFYAIDF